MKGWASGCQVSGGDGRNRIGEPSRQGLHGGRGRRQKPLDSSRVLSYSPFILKGCDWWGLPTGSPGEDSRNEIGQFPASWAGSAPDDCPLRIRAP